MLGEASKAAVLGLLLKAPLRDKAPLVLGMLVVSM